MASLFDLKVKQIGLQGLPEAFLRAEVATVNRVADMTRTYAVRQIRQTYNAPPSALRNSMRVKRAWANNPTAIIVTAGRRLPLSLFAARKGVSGVTVQIRAGAGRKALRHSFLARMGSHRGVYMRVTTKRFPVEQKFTISVPEMMNAGGVRPLIDKYIHDTLPGVLDHNLEYFVGKAI